MPFCFLNVYKEKGMTSFDVIFKLRKKFNIKKIGHSGTLDPMAEGVMQVAIGGASRLIEYLHSDKEYIAEIQFGYTTDTLDCEGEIIKTDNPSFDKNKLELSIKQFLGKIVQIPPKYSAIKVNGKKLCDIARKKPDIEIEVPKRNVEIYNIELIEFNRKKYIAKIKINCSKGTYIRTLAQDIAKSLNTNSYLLSLKRTMAGKFRIEDSKTIDKISLENDSINPIHALDLDKIEITQEQYNYIKNGVSIPFISPLNKVVMLIFNKKLVSIANLSDNKIIVKKFFNQ